VWAISAGGKEEVKEKEFNGVKRGVFSYYLCKALSTDENEEESLFSDDNQKSLRKQAKDAARMLVKIASPNEITTWLRNKLIKEKLSEHVPNCGSLSGSYSSQLIGIPVIGRSSKDYILKYTMKKIKSAKKIAKQEEKEIKEKAKETENKQNGIENELKEIKEMLAKQGIRIEEMLAKQDELIAKAKEDFQK